MPKNKGKPIHGWLVVDKAQGVTSNWVVGQVKKLTGAAKVGHAGTLDPLATGILPIALGEATKTVSYVMNGLKEYRFTIVWGEARDSDDAEGRVTGMSPVCPEKNNIIKALKDFVGDIEQIPPAFSAVKVDGRHAYDLARKDEKVDLSPRRVHVENFELLEIPDCNHATFRVSCGKGTYIRSLARDLARHLGTLGYVSALRRTRVRSFCETDAISLDSPEFLGHIGAFSEHVLSILTVLDDIPALALSEDQARCLKNGQAVPLFKVKVRPASCSPESPSILCEDLSPDLLKKLDGGHTEACALCGDRLVALVRCEEGRARPFRVFNL
ncbi:MAG: tRNA pseudouridine(55) synthase TruB [Alphaproteobacteria bacterium]|jgi:tRNA pseudouridine55 synthase|nr:tRNA pseudouridine(55) synthase TruB [Alphaproteobacteria bacterium]MDP7468365.1 tRNA pseudouridine(55) synthase TruB [Alphaproteobacteria bacterium]